MRTALSFWARSWLMSADLAFEDGLLLLELGQLGDDVLELFLFRLSSLEPVSLLADHPLLKEEASGQERR